MEDGAVRVEERKANRIWIGIDGIANVANSDRAALEEMPVKMVVRQETEGGREVKSPQKWLDQGGPIGPRISVFCRVILVIIGRSIGLSTATAITIAVPITITIIITVTVTMGSVEIGTAVIGPVAVSVPCVTRRVMPVSVVRPPIEWAMIRTISAVRKRRNRMIVAMISEERRAVAIASVVGPVVLQSRVLLRSTPTVVRRRRFVTPIAPIASIWTMRTMMEARKMSVGPETEARVGLRSESGLMKADAVIRGILIAGRPIDVSNLRNRFSSRLEVLAVC